MPPPVSARLAAVDKAEPGQFLRHLYTNEGTSRQWRCLEFAPPWPARTYLASLHLSRLSQAQAAVLAERVAGDRPLPPATRQQIVAQTDGVPLFVEEVTRAVRGSGLLQEARALLEALT